MNKNASDPKQVKEASDRERRGKSRSADDCHFMMAHEQSQRFLFDLLGECGVYRLSFNHSGSITAFNEGQRDIGQKIIARLVEADPTYYPKLMLIAHEKGFNDV